MKRKTASFLAAIMISASVTAMSGCGDVINNAESTANNAIGKVTSTIGNNPATSLYNQINEKETQYGGKKLEEVLKNFYAGVVSGSINEETAGYLVTEKLPLPKANVSERKAAANDLTVLSAIEHQGMQTLYTDDYLADFMYGNSKIVYKDSASVKEFSDPVTLDTKLGDIFRQ